MEEETDAQLVARARADDTQAFRSLVERYQPLAFYLALRLVGRQEVAHELVQEALLQAYLSLDRLRDDVRFKSWLYGIVLNLCRNWRRKHQTNEISLEKEGALFEHLLSPDPQVLLEEQELKQAVRSAIDLLTPKNQAVAFLFYYQELGIQEIASRLAISLSAVKNRLHTGRKELQAHLQALYPDIVIPPGREKRRKGMLPLQLFKVIHRHQPFYDTHLLLLLDEQQQRAWTPYVSDFRSPDRRMDQPAQQATADTEQDTITLLVKMIDALEGKVEEIAIDELYEDLLYARVRFSGQRGQHTLKARLHDALRLAIHERPLISIAETVFERLFLTLADYGQTQEQQLTIIEQIALDSPYLLQMRREHDNLDFSQGLRGWKLYQPPHAVSYALDTQATRSGKPVLTLTLHEWASMLGHVSLMGYDNFRADAYCGKRVRATAYLRAEGVQQPIFSMSLLGSFTLPTGISNGSEQDITYHSNSEMIQIVDTHAWTPHTLVMDVPSNTNSISFSFSTRSQGKGSIWLDGIELEIVDESVPLTLIDIHIYPPRLQPFNLDFTHGFLFWEMAGQSVWQYERGIDTSSGEGSPCAFLRSLTDEPARPCALQQMVNAQQYWGKSIHLSASIKTASATAFVSLSGIV